MAKSMTLSIPPGAVKATQWFKMGNHPAALQDYVCGPTGDVDIERYFIYYPPHYRYTDVKPGDWLFELPNGTFEVNQTYRKKK
jgi:hypothetical protein